MKIWVLAFFGGLAGAALVGRWFIGLTRGRLTHADILESPRVPGELTVGWAFHFLVGGGGVALLYPLLFRGAGLAPPARQLLDGVLFGLATSLLPWLILLPSFGWGWFGRRGPRGSNALLASVVSHLPYGLAVGAVIALGSWL